MLKLFVLAGLLLFQSEGGDPDNPPPEPPASTAACHNYHDSAEKNCRCPKGMRGQGSAGEATPPDTAKGETWCSTYCLHKCMCIGMTHKMYLAPRL